MDHTICGHDVSFGNRFLIDAHYIVFLREETAVVRCGAYWLCSFNRHLLTTHPLCAWAAGLLQRAAALALCRLPLPYGGSAQLGFQCRARMEFVS